MTSLQSHHESFRAIFDILTELRNHIIPNDNNHLVLAGRDCVRDKFSSSETFTEKKNKYSYKRTFKDTHREKKLNSSAYEKYECGHLGR